MKIDMLNNFSHNQTDGSTALSTNSVFVGKMGDVPRTLTFSFNEAPTVPSGTTLKIAVLGSDTNDFTSTTGTYAQILETRAYGAGEMTTGGFSVALNLSPHHYQYERLKYTVTGSSMSNVKMEANLTDGAQTNGVAPAK